MATHGSTATKRLQRQKSRAEAFEDGRLDAEDMARALIGFRKPSVPPTASMRYVRSSADGMASAYVFDNDSGMVYILD